MPLFTRARPKPRAAALVALVTLVLAATSLITATGAQADVTPTGIHTPDSGGIDVLLADPGALWVKATVRASTAVDAPVLAATDDLTFDATRGWFTDTPIQLPAGTAYGDYPVDIDYRLATGTVQHWSGAANGPAGLFSYRKHIGVAAVHTDRTYTDFDNQGVTVSGTIQSFDPASGLTAPGAAGITVNIAWTTRVGYTYTPHSIQTMTDPSGNFSGLVMPGGELDSGTAAVINTGSDEMPTTATAFASVVVHPTTVRISGGPTRVRVHDGHAFTVSGTVERLTPDTGWQPLVGATVVTATSTEDVYGNVPPPVASGTSTATGTYAYSVTPPSTGGTYLYDQLYTYVQPSAYISAWPNQYGYVSTQAYIPWAGSFSGMHFSLDAFHDVTATGNLLNNCAGQRLLLQYSATGSSSWVTIGSTTTNTSIIAPCSFSVTGIGHNDGYYRVYHAESDEMLVLASAASRLHRIPTRFVSFVLSPTSPVLNGTLTATGRLQQYTSGAWHPLASGHVVLAFEPAGQSQYYWVVKAYSNSTGAFTLRGKFYGTGHWGVYYEPDTKHFYSETAVRYVKAG